MKGNNKMKICSTCGFENEDSASFCQNCFTEFENTAKEVSDERNHESGKHISSETPSEAVPENKPNGNNVPVIKNITEMHKNSGMTNRSKDNSNIKIVIISLVIIIVVAAGAVGGKIVYDNYYFNRNNYYEYPDTAEDNDYDDYNDDNNYDDYDDYDNYDDYEDDTTEPTTESTTEYEPDIPDELIKYADYLEEENRYYIVDIGHSGWKVNYRSSPVRSDEYKIGNVTHGDRIYVEYIYKDTWAVANIDGEYVFISIFNNPKKPTESGRMLYIDD